MVPPLGRYPKEPKTDIQIKMYIQTTISSLFTVIKRKTNPNAQKLMNGQTKYGIYMLWNIIQP